jgi:hypothetical protein
MTIGVNRSKIGNESGGLKTPHEGRVRATIRRKGRVKTHRIEVKWGDTNDGVSPRV